MEATTNRRHHVKRVALPSGKTIEVVYFRRATPLDEARAGRATPPAEPHQELHVCLDCDSELVYPVQWEEAGPENWDVAAPLPELRVVPRRASSPRTPSRRFDEELDRGTDALVADLQAPDAREHGRGDRPLRRARSTADAILPEDF